MNFLYLYFNDKLFILFSKKKKKKKRDDTKSAEDYKITGGAVLHLVLALRGGF